MAKEQKKSGKFRKARVTQTQIADRLGLSRQVVSSILGPGDHSTARYAAETAREVLGLAEELGYPLQRPQIMLHELHLVVAVSLSVINGLLFDMLTLGCRREGIGLQIDVVPYGEEPRLLQSSVDEGRVCLAFPLEDHDCSIDRLVQAGHRVLRMNAPGEPGPVINYDDDDGIRRLLQLFKDSGRQRPVFFSPGEDRFSRPRIEAWHRHAAACGFAEAAVHQHGSSRMVANMVNYLRLHPRSDAILLSHSVVIGPMVHALGLVDRSVGDDLMLCSFFTDGHIPFICSKALCLDIDDDALARHLIASCQAWCLGQPMPEHSSWPYRLRSVLD